MAKIEKDFVYMEFPLQIRRQFGAGPLDPSSVYYSLEEAQNYALNSPLSYIGQPITVVEEQDNGSAEVSLYLITGKQDKESILQGIPLGDFIKKSGDVMNGNLQLNRSLLSKNGDNPLYILPYVTYNTIDPTHDTNTYLKELLKWICQNYPGVRGGRWIGRANPNSAGMIDISIYNTDNVNSDGLPQYSEGRLQSISNDVIHFNTNNYNLVIEYLSTRFNKYLPLTGGTMSGELKAHGGLSLQSSTTEVTTGDYFITMDAFASGGKLHWIRKDNLKSALDITGKVSKSGDTMSGALNFANGTKNNVGDDVAIGDGNIGGTLCVQGLNASTGIAFLENGHSWGTASRGTIKYNGVFDIDKLVKVHKEVQLEGATTDSTAYGSDNPKLMFHNEDASQNIALVFTDYDNQGAPASLNVRGNQGNEIFRAPVLIAETRLVAKSDTNDLISNSNELNFGNPNGTAHIGYRNANITEYRFSNGTGTGNLAPVRALQLYENDTRVYSANNLPDALKNLGNQTAITSREEAGLRLHKVYNNGYPTSYGNVLTLGGEGGGQLLVGWSGTNEAHAPVYVRNRRDAHGSWSPWAMMYTEAYPQNYMPDVETGNQLTFNYGGASISWNNITWLAGWNGAELRAISKPSADDLGAVDKTSTQTISGTKTFTSTTTQMYGLRLRNTTAYGCYLRFGDGDYAYLQEDTDDHMKMYFKNGVKISNQWQHYIEMNSDGITINAPVVNSTIKSINFNTGSYGNVKIDGDYALTGSFGSTFWAVQGFKSGNYGKIRMGIVSYCWSSRGGTYSVSYPSGSFVAEPVVMVTGYGRTGTGDNYGIALSVISSSSTGFTVRMSSENSGNYYTGFAWVAISGD